jgi:hypothetical protein
VCASLPQGTRLSARLPVCMFVNAHRRAKRLFVSLPACLPLCMFELVCMRVGII